MVYRYANIVVASYTGVVLLGLATEVANLMRAVDRANLTGHFSWIGSDGWGGQVTVSNGNELQV